MSVATSNSLFKNLNIGEGDLRLVIKDSIDIAGYVTGMGSALMEGFSPATESAEIVNNILARGGKVIGKAKMHELAYGVTGINNYLGTPVNSNYPNLIPGGSSSGSATAVSEGAAEIGIGTDTGGSIRMPASCCGLVGFKPTFGRVSRVGVHPNQSSLDCVGPITKNIAMAEQAMALIDPSFKILPDLVEYTIGIVRGDWQADVAAAIEVALSKIPQSMRSVELPGLKSAHEAGLTIIAAENWSAFHDIVDAPGLGEDIRKRLLLAQKVTPQQLDEAYNIQAAFRAEVDVMLAKDIDVLVLPALPMPAPTLAEAENPAAIVAHTQLLRPFNVSGHPAITLPLENEAGQPFGLQLIGGMMQDEKLSAIARQIERQITL